MAEDSFTELVIKVIRANGLRVTRQRIAVARLLAKEDVALTVQQIYDKIRQSEYVIDQVSVYRSLECLEELGLVHKLANSNYIRCAGDRFDTCHHHMICTECGKVIEFECQEMYSLLIKEVRDKKFIHTDHILEVWGKCDACCRISEDESKKEKKKNNDE